MEEDFMEEAACLNAMDYLTKAEQEQVLDDLYDLSEKVSPPRMRWSVSEATRLRLQGEGASLTESRLTQQKIRSHAEDLEDGEIAEEDSSKDPNSRAAPLLASPNASGTANRSFAFNGHPLGGCSSCGELGHTTDTCGFVSGKFCSRCHTKSHSSTSCPQYLDQPDRRSRPSADTELRRRDFGSAEEDARRCEVCRSADHVARFCPNRCRSFPSRYVPPPVGRRRSPFHHQKFSPVKRWSRYRTTQPYSRRRRSSSSRSGRSRRASRKPKVTEADSTTKKVPGTLSTLDRLNMIDIDAIPVPPPVTEDTS